MINSIIHGDCLEVMKQIPDKSIDMCFTDPPYKLIGGGVSGLMRDGIFDPSVYDNKGQLFKTLKFIDWMPEVYRVLKENAEGMFKCSRKKWL